MHLSERESSRTNCGSMGTIQFNTRNSDLVYDAMEPPIGYTRVETFVFQSSHSFHSRPCSQMPFHAIDLDSSISLWIHSSASSDGRSVLRLGALKTQQDGRLTIRVPISNDAGRNTARGNPCRHGNQHPQFTIPEYQIETNTQATGSSVPFGGYIQFTNKLSVSGVLPSLPLMNVILRYNVKERVEIQCCDQTHQNNDADQDNVCSETISNISTSTMISIWTLHVSSLTWLDQDDSDRCLNFGLWMIRLQEHEAICLHIEQVDGTASLSEREQIRFLK